MQIFHSRISDEMRNFKSRKSYEMQNFKTLAQHRQLIGRAIAGPDRHQLREHFTGRARRAFAPLHRLLLF